MPLADFSCRDFRCLAAASLRPDPRFSLIVGENASGKTSLLEAVGYLGRGRSFRNASTDSLVRHGESHFLLNGTVASGALQQRVGVQNGREGLSLSVDGDRSGGQAALADALPLQVIDPEVHELVAGGPEQRRRFLDWVAFHVEPGFLAAWRRFRRALKQRNALLRQGSGDLSAWDREFLAAAVPVHEARERVSAGLAVSMGAVASRLLQEPVAFTYASGWPQGESLAEVLDRNGERDRLAGSSQAGPHRADLKLRVLERMARKLVSRGQQKLLACGMVLGAAELVQQALNRRLLLLLDDPAAELDGLSLGRLMSEVVALDGQVIATSLVADSPAFPVDRRVFHVERGRLRAV